MYQRKMAVIQRGILGGFRNKIGNVVGSSWKGIAVMKALPLSVANPQTAGQQAQRAKFSGASKFGSQILATIIKPLWDRFAQKESGFNAFVKANLVNFDGGFLSLTQELKISKGTLAVPDAVLTVADVSAKTATFTWNAAPVGDANPSDELYVVIYNSANQQVQGFSAVAVRSDAGTVVDVDIEFEVGDSIYGFTAFRKADGSKVSNTSVDVRVAQA
jgi:hypothetical protein